MKLIIDIDENVYTRLFDNGIQDNEIVIDDICEMARTLRLGKPYEERPQGDLISRDTLKEDFKSRLADCNKWIENAKDNETKIRASAVKAFIAEVIMTIDNAPTVIEADKENEND